MRWRVPTALRAAAPASAAHVGAASTGCLHRAYPFGQRLRYLEIDMLCSFRKSLMFVLSWIQITLQALPDARKPATATSAPDSK
jgi:hypothetical protein